MSDVRMTWIVNSSDRVKAKVVESHLIGDVAGSLIIGDLVLTHRTHGDERITVDDFVSMLRNAADEIESSHTDWDEFRLRAAGEDALDELDDSVLPAFSCPFSDDEAHRHHSDHLLPGAS